VLVNQRVQLVLGVGDHGFALLAAILPRCRPARLACALASPCCSPSGRCRNAWRH